MSTSLTELPSQMRASVLTGAGMIGMQERPVPTVLPDEVLIKIAAVGVCGSDVHYYREGRIGDFVVDAPLVLGHEAGGRIVALGDGVAPERLGERVAIEPQRPCRVCAQCKAVRYNLCPHMRFYATPPVDGALCEYVTIQADFAHPVPDALSDDAAALLEPLSVGIWTARKARIVPGSSVLIAGAGPIGVITAQAAKAFGATDIIVSDPAGDRRQLVTRFGATRTLDPREESVHDLGVDAFIDASGVAPAVVDGIKAVRGAGTVVLVGMGADEVAAHSRHPNPGTHGHRRVPLHRHLAGGHRPRRVGTGRPRRTGHRALPAGGGRGRADLRHGAGQSQVGGAAVTALESFNPDRQDCIGHRG